MSVEEVWHEMSDQQVAEIVEQDHDLKRRERAEKELVLRQTLRQEAEGSR